MRYSKQLVRALSSSRVKRRQPILYGKGRLAKEFTQDKEIHKSEINDTITFQKIFNLRIIIRNLLAKIQ
jgi:hypothetical protein